MWVKIVERECFAYMVLHGIQRFDCRIIFHCGISMKITYGNITTLNFFHYRKRVLSIGEQHLQNTCRSKNPSEPNHPINDLA
jgi:hypothetical protein